MPRAFALLFLISVLNAQTPLSCTITAAKILPARAEGHYEQTGDLLIQCINGAAAAGVQYVGLDVTTPGELIPLTSRTLDHANAITESLLFIDEPERARQIVCETPLSPAACQGSTAFPGIRAGASRIRFVFPFTQPGPGKTRVLRITNLRVAASQLKLSVGSQANVDLSVTNTTAGVPAPRLTLPFTAGASITAASASRSIAGGLLGEPPKYQCEDVNRELALDSAAPSTADGRRFTIRLRESDFPPAFRRRNDARPLSFTAPDPVRQDLPGLVYGTETQFYNPTFPGIYANAGLAASGTRFYVRVHNVPRGVKLFVENLVAVPLAVTPASGDVTTGFARRVVADPDGVGAFTPERSSSLFKGGIAPMDSLGAYHQAVFEILETDAIAMELIDVPVFPAFLASSGPVGVMSASVGYMPVAPDVTGESAITPRFASYSLTFAAAAIGGCAGSFIAPQSALFEGSGGSGSIAVTTTASTTWTAVSRAPWITVKAGASGQGNGTVEYTVAANDIAARRGTIIIGPAIFTINQAAAPLTVQLNPTSRQWPGEAGGTGSFTVIANGPWTASSNATWLAILSTANNEVRYSIAANPGPAARVGTIRVGSAEFTVTQAGQVPVLGAGLLFVPLPFTCRLVDTRNPNNASFGSPALAPAVERIFQLTLSPCLLVPAYPYAVALNVTVVPRGRLGYVTVWGPPDFLSRSSPH